MKILCKGRSLFWIQVLLAVCVSWISTVTAQPGFVSIDCGSDQDSYDNVTQIFWQRDDNYIKTGRNINNITLSSDNTSPIANMGQLATLRLFDGPNNRDCYVLPVVPGENYLVRATFLYGRLGDGSNPISFYVTMDNNIMGSLGWNGGVPLFSPISFEIIYSPSSSTLDFCLLRQQGPSFISALELRKLESGMYAAGIRAEQNAFMFLIERTNCGPPETGPVQFWRHPNDIYDRIWSLYGANDNATRISNHSLPLPPKSFAQDPDQPPQIVMEDGWVYYNSNILWVYSLLGQTPVGQIYTAAYFQELDGNASATNVRGIDYMLNDKFVTTFNTSDQPKEVFTTANISDTWVNMSFLQASWSHLRPILNAYEIYGIGTYNISSTQDEDVKALHALQVRLNLTDWTGDPCSPHPFAWLKCTADKFPRINTLFLGNNVFGGSFPLEIANLTQLTYLDLNNNSFSGSIPDFSGLHHLQSIFLQNNNLTGEIPSFLGSAFPNLTRLDLDNNNLNGTVPSDLHNPSLDLTVSNNPQLIIPSWLNSTAPSPTASSSGTSIGAVVGGIVGGLVVLAVVAVIVWMLCTRKSRARSNIIRAIGNAENRSPGDLSISRKALAGSMILLSLQEVSDATKKFSKKIGEGSFGPVYYGKLPDGQEVAVKVKSTDSRQGATEFVNEVELLSRIHHRNLVSLVGYCEEGNQQILIYVYVSNGTLRDHLYGDKSRKSLDWRTRLDIALNSARGLEYLHTDCNPRIIHRDVKSSNILLSENLIAKVADFGISKQAPEGVFSGVDTLLKGTPGYFHPEYFISQRLTQKSDVYSFGVVLLEIISGRHPHVSELPDGTSGTLIQWVRSAASNGNVMDVVDPSLKGEFHKGSMMKVVSLAIKSIDLTTAKRPDMRQVVRTLTEAIELELFSEVLIERNYQDTSIEEEEEPDNHKHSLVNSDSLPSTNYYGQEDDPASIVLPR